MTRPIIAAHLRKLSDLGLDEVPIQGKRSSSSFENHGSTPETRIDTDPGFITFPGRKPIYDTHRYGILSFTDVIVKSSNVGAIKVGQKVGADTLVSYIDKFGLGQKLSPDLRVETADIV
jgi:cell division protein FtsI (penicillin-binding protein 3)